MCTEVVQYAVEANFDVTSRGHMTRTLHATPMNLVHTLLHCDVNPCYSPWLLKIRVNEMSAGTNTAEIRANFYDVRGEKTQDIHTSVEMFQWFSRIESNFELN